MTEHLSVYTTVTTYLKIHPLICFCLSALKDTWYILETTKVSDPRFIIKQEEVSFE